MNGTLIAFIIFVFSSLAALAIIIYDRLTHPPLNGDAALIEKALREFHDSK